MMNHKSTISVLLIFAAAFIGCDSRKNEFSRAELIMDTRIEVKIRGGAQGDLDAAFVEIRRIDSVMSRFNASSEVSAINRHAGADAISVSQEMWDVLKLSVEVSEKSGGAFDITIQPAIMLWSRHKDRLPSAPEIKNIRRIVGWEKIKFLPDNHIYIEPGMAINLDAVAKGYAVEKALEVLKNRGCGAAIVNAGGDVSCFAGGEYPKWKISVRGPEEKSAGIEVVTAKGSVATSGIGRRFTVIQGIKYPHVFDPKTLSPVTGDILTSSAWALTAAKADAWATAGLVSGRSIMNAAENEGIGIALEEKDGAWLFNGVWGKSFDRK